MLSSLVPGLRELRAPLAGGYLWLISIWLIFGDALPGRSEVEQSGPLNRLYELEPLISTFGLAVAVVGLGVALLLAGGARAEAEPAARPDSEGVDRLRTCPEDRLLYESVKRKLAREDWTDMNAYARAKSEVVEEILARLASPGAKAG